MWRFARFVRHATNFCPTNRESLALGRYTESVGKGWEQEQSSKDGPGPSAETLAACVPLSRSQRQTVVNTITGRHLATLVICAGIAYLGLAAGQWSPDLSHGWPPGLEGGVTRPGKAAHFTGTSPAAVKIRP